MSTLTMNAVQIHEFGKNYLKTKKMSPDAMMQLAFQVSYDKKKFFLLYIFCYLFNFPANYCILVFFTSYYRSLNCDSLRLVG